MHRRLQSFIIILFLSVIATACKANYDHSALMGGTSGGSGFPDGGDGGLILNDGWDRPTDLSDNFGAPGDGLFLEKHRSAMDSSGNSIVVWHQLVDSSYRIFMSEYRNGVWTHPSGATDSISPDGGEAENPDVAMDDNGNAIIVWRQFDGNYFQVFKSEYRNGVWTHPAGLSDNISPNGQPTDDPQVAMDNSGNAIIVWSQNLTENFVDNKIFKSEYRNGVWTHPSGLADYISPNGINAFTPVVAMDNSGNAIIAWQNERIFISEYRNGAWAHPAGAVDYISPDVGDAQEPYIAMDNIGNAIIAYEVRIGDLWLLYRSEYRNGAWMHPLGPNDHMHQIGLYASAPAVAMNDNGDAIIAYAGDEGSGINLNMLFISEYRNGIWSEPTDLEDYISPNNNANSTLPHAAMDNNGNAVVVWNQAAWYGNQIFKAEFRNGIWSYPVDSDDTVSIDESNAYAPRIVMNDPGKALITWSQFSGFEWFMFKAEYGF